MKSLTCLALVLLSGCAYHLDENYTLEIDPSFSADQQETVITSADDWMNNLDGVFSYQPCVGIGCGGKGRAKIRVHAVSQAFVDSKRGEDALGYTERYYGTDDSDVYIPVDVSYGAGDLQQLITHELGHSLGAFHISEGNVMCAYSDCAAKTVQCADRNMVMALRGYFQKTCK